MATDMDIDMDLDIGLMDDDFQADDLVVPAHDIIPDNGRPEQQAPIFSTPNDTSEANSNTPVLEKVHIRGLDNLNNDNVHSFAAEYYGAHRPVRIEWINDTSANLIYGTAEIASEALVAFAAIGITDVAQLQPLQTIPAKPFPLHPQTHLEVRIAVQGDRKEIGARHKSRFYLMNPEYDPAERRARGNKYRDRDDGGYRSQRYDERENRKRQDRDGNEGFDASLYDDDEAALAKRRDRGSRRSSSDSISRGRPRGRGGQAKELFPERVGESGRLRGRSASPMKDNEVDRGAERRKDLAANANREKAQLIKARLREAQSTKELFPQSVNGKHRRSDAFDAADETADLFSTQLTLPLFDDDSDTRPVNLASRVTNRNPLFSIRGAAQPPQPQVFNIKGASKTVKELFPSSLGDNSGKELFSDRLEGRGRRRQKAEDLFH